jgi:hypothetical protein
LGGVSASRASKKDPSSEKESAWTDATPPRAPGLIGDGGGDSAPADASGMDDLSARRIRAFRVLMIMASGGGGGGGGEGGQVPGGVGEDAGRHEIDSVLGLRLGIDSIAEFPWSGSSSGSWMRVVLVMVEGKVGGGRRSEEKKKKRWKGEGGSARPF